MKQVVEERKDIAFYLVMYAPAHPAAREALQYTLCGKDNAERLARFEESMKKGEIPKVENCDKSAVIDSIADFARQHSINGTPGVFMQNGTAIRGFVEKDELLGQIEADQKKK